LELGQYQIQILSNQLLLFETSLYIKMSSYTNDTAEDGATKGYVQAGLRTVTN